MRLELVTNQDRLVEARLSDSDDELVECYASASATNLLRLGKEQRRVFEQLGRDGRNPSKCVTELHKIGLEIRQGFGERIATHLDESAHAFLELHVAEDLLDVPWELAMIGDQPLSRHCCVGRRLLGRPADMDSSPDQSPEKIRVAILANPDFSLSGAEREGMAIRNRLQRVKQLDVESPREIRSHADLQELLQTHDWLHFAGHAEVLRRRSTTGSSAVDFLRWKMGDTCFLDAGDLGRAGVWPKLIFANGCGTLQIVEREASTCLVRSLCRDRQKLVVGTACQHHDQFGRRFAIFCYEFLMLGMPIGMALLEARRQLATDFPAAAVWGLNYLLYGSPESRLFTVKADMISSRDRFLKRTTANVQNKPTANFPVACCQCHDSIMGPFMVGREVPSADGHAVMCVRCTATTNQSVPAGTLAAPAVVPPPLPDRVAPRQSQPTLSPKVSPTAPSLVAACETRVDQAEFKPDHYSSAFVSFELMSRVDDFARLLGRRLHESSKVRDVPSGLLVDVEWQALAPSKLGAEVLEPINSTVHQGFRAVGTGSSSARTTNDREVIRVEWLVCQIQMDSDQDRHAYGSALRSALIRWMKKARLASVQTAASPTVFLVAAIDGWPTELMQNVLQGEPWSDVLGPGCAVVLSDTLGHQLRYCSEQLPAAAMKDVWQSWKPERSLPELIAELQSMLPLPRTVNLGQWAQVKGVKPDEALAAARWVAAENDLKLAQIVGFGWVLSPTE